MTISLTNAVPVFQQDKLFQPLISIIWVFPDAILLYAPGVSHHGHLLSHLSVVVLHYGLMLSQHKKIFSSTKINLLEMFVADGTYVLQSKDGTYVLQPPIATPYLEFFYIFSDLKQVQPFLGISAYIAPIVPYIAH